MHAADKPRLRFQNGPSLLPEGGETLARLLGFKMKAIQDRPVRPKALFRSASGLSRACQLWAGPEFHDALLRFENPREAFCFRLRNSSLSNGYED